MATSDANLLIECQNIYRLENDSTHILTLCFYIHQTFLNYSTFILLMIEIILSDSRKYLRTNGCRVSTLTGIAVYGLDH